MKRKHAGEWLLFLRRLCCCPHFRRRRNQAYTTYTSEALRLSFQVDAGYSVTERDGYIWVYPGETGL